MKTKLVKYIKGLRNDDGAHSLLDRSLLSTYNSVRKIRKKSRSIDAPVYSRMYLQSRNLKRNLKGKNFNFVTVDQASIWTMEWIKTFPRQYDLIVGVPRSGMLIASIVALKLGKGLTTPELFAEGKYWHSVKIKDKPPLEKMNNVLVVDDAIDTGRAMAKAMDLMHSVYPNIEIDKGSLIVHEDNKSKVDLYHQVIQPPRVYEWNILHRKIASYWDHGVLGIDMDGVLCENCPKGVDADEDSYRQWLRSAKPYLIPAFEIDAIVTCRLEKYRAETEQWLAANNVKYKSLHMWDVPTKGDRNGKFAKHKIDALLKLKPDMFWESSWDQSQKIWNRTKIPTLCIDEMTLLN